MLRKLFGKYRVLVISIALFLVFDLGVLVLNFYTSGKIAEQTEKINIAGRQRTLTQQMSKATLYIKAQKLQQWVYQDGLNELRDHYILFGETIDALNNGGQTRSPETGALINVLAVSNLEGKAILSEATILWNDFEAVIEPMMADILITDEEIKPASEFIAKNNLKLYDLMNKLTEHFTHESEKQTTFLRMVQLAGISLATINFFVILFHFLKQLRSRDEKIELKQHESDQILKTIDEGVFLIDEQLFIGGQHSRYLQTIFAEKKISGRRLSRFLQAYFPDKTVKTTLNFVKLYFTDHINPDLIEDVNPLKQVKATVSLASGELVERYLSFAFARVRQENNQTIVLATVKDITDSVLLAEQADKTETEVEQQLALFSQILPVPASDLEIFVGESLSSLERINTELKNTRHMTDNYDRTLNRLFREAHKLKGNASALNFEWIETQLHDFESTIVSLKKQGEGQSLNGRDLVPLTVALKKLYSSIETLSDLRKRLLAYGINQGISVSSVVTLSSVQPETKRWLGLHQFSTKIAAEQGSEVELQLRGFKAPLETGLDKILYPMTIQLMRNSIVHGVETKAERETLKKPTKGHVMASISHDSFGNYRYIFEDDGRGFNYKLIRNELINSGRYTAGQISKLKKTDLIRLAFSDQFSTKRQLDENAGRGVGLPLILEQIRMLNGKLKIRSVANELTQFIIDFKYTGSDTIKQAAS